MELKKGMILKLGNVSRKEIYCFVYINKTISLCIGLVITDFGIFPRFWNDLKFLKSVFSSKDFLQIKPSDINEYELNKGYRSIIEEVFVEKI